MPRVVVVGGGWAGCAAALAALRAGAEAILLERADTLLGTGQVGGIMRNNGRFTATEELTAMGAGDLFRLTDKNARHEGISFPGHEHASLYDVGLMEPMVRRYLLEEGVEIWTVSRVKAVERAGETLKSVALDNGEVIEGDVFVDATGSLGPASNCSKYGNGCSMCVTRCTSFGGRISVTLKAGIPEKAGRRPDGQLGAMSGSCKLHKGSLARWVQEQLDRAGVAILPVPKDLAEQKMHHLSVKCCQQYALPEFAENLILLDTGHAKLMTSFFPIDDLRRVPGLENARYEDPYAGGKGNSIRYLALAPRDDALRVRGIDNLFCAGEKAGTLVGHTEAICTGTLAGHNAARQAYRNPLLTLPQTTAIGDIIHQSGEATESEKGLEQKFTFSGSDYFERMKSLGLYTIRVPEIRARIGSAGLTGVFATPLHEGVYA